MGEREKERKRGREGEIVMTTNGGLVVKRKELKIEKRGQMKGNLNKRKA